MIDEPQNRNTGEQSPTAEQLVRLKHEINEGITYGPGLNARQVVALKTLSAEQWASIRRDYSGWIKEMQVFTDTLLLVAAAGILVCPWLFVQKGLLRWAALGIATLAFFALVALFKREGHREGYLDGYDNGFEAGINVACGIDEKEAMDIHERATEMKVDEHLMKAFADRKKQI